MKITIDTELKTIQIDELVPFSDFIKLIGELGLEEYDLIPNGWSPYNLPASASQQPVPAWYQLYSTNTTLK